MGMSGSRESASKAVSSEINVTPLIDVLLVLLIIFIVVMPILLKVETLTIPRELTSDQTTDQVSLTVKVRSDLSIALDDGSSPNGTPVDAVDLARVLRPRVAAMGGASDKVVFVEFEDGVPWNEVVSTMD